MNEPTLRVSPDEFNQIRSLSESVVTALKKGDDAETPQAAYREKLSAFFKREGLDIAQHEGAPFWYELPDGKRCRVEGEIGSDDL